MNSQLPLTGRAGAMRTATSRSVVRWLRRATFLLHRWIGIGLALLMAVWALSGIVMMYVAFPDLTRDERLAGLEPIEMAQCCAIEVEQQLGQSEIGAASVEMLAGKPVLRWAGEGGPGILDLSTGEIPLVDAAMAQGIAQAHMRNTGAGEIAATVEQIDRDQWTVYGRFRQHEPLFKVAFADEAGTTLYVSGTTAEVVQDTTSHERFWNWLGAVPHWLYFTAFREIQWLWYDFVVYASVLGVFLTGTGLYIGIRQYGRGKRRSPYRGLALWHHWTGLIFGIFTLTWVVSGLFSMQPWGWFESEGPAAEQAALAGRPADAADVAALVAALQSGNADQAVRADLTIQDGAAFALLSDAQDMQWRAGMSGLSRAPLNDGELAARAQLAGLGRPIASQELITEGDAYHYGHKQDVVLPAWRVIYADDEQTRLYFDPRTGEGIRKVDAAGRWYRWLHLGLHRLDFTGLVRSRPLWDLITLPLMAGVSLLCLIGCWMGWRRITRKQGMQRKARA